MIERAEITARVEKIFEARRFENMKLRELRIQEVSEALPGFQEIERKIAGTGFRLVSLAGKGRKGDEEYTAAERELEDLGNRRKKLLEEGGFGVDYIDRCESCHECGDTGRKSDGNGLKVPCGCYIDCCRSIILEESGLPVKKGFEAFDPSVFAPADRPAAERILSDASEFVNGFENARNRLFFGKSGSGKTYLASLAATELVRKGVYGVYVTVPMLMQTLLYFGDDERLQERRDRLSEIVHTADLLVLDELGTERLTPARQDLLESIIDGIVADHSRKCIVISNLAPQEMMMAYGERMFSRLASMKLVKFDFPSTPDLRLKV